MKNYLRERIQARLDALNLNPFEVARTIGAERTFISELLVGKKQSIRQKMIPAVAAALDCDPEYLVGAQASPRAIPDAAGGGAGADVPLVGICEAGAWRGEGGTITPPQSIAVRADPRFPNERQAAYIVRGEHAAGLGVHDGDVIVAVAGGPVRAGDAVVARRSRANGAEHETSLMAVANGELLTQPGKGKPQSERISDAEIVGRVVLSLKVF